MLFGLVRLNFFLFSKTNTFRVADVSVETVLLIYSRGKNKFLKKLYFVRIWKILSGSLVKYLEFDVGNNWKR